MVMWAPVDLTQVIPMTEENPAIKPRLRVEQKLKKKEMLFYFNSIDLLKKQYRLRKS